VVQGGYYALTGLWPLFDIDSFQAVTGPKTDLWLVRTVGLLIVVIAGVMLLGARKEKPPVEVVVLAIAAAVGLAVTDVVIVSARAASWVYLLDAGAEIGLLAWWGKTLFPSRSRVIYIP